MKQFLASVLVLSMFSLGIVGCAEKSSTTSETEVSTPDRTTTVVGQQQGGFDPQQQGRSRGQQQTGPNDQQIGRFKDEKQSGANGRQQGASKDQQQGGSKDEKQDGSKGQNQSGRRPKTGYTAKSVHGRFEKERQELIVSELETLQIRIEVNEEDRTWLHGCTEVNEQAAALRAASLAEPLGAHSFSYFGIWMNERLTR